LELKCNPRDESALEKNNCEGLKGWNVKLEYSEKSDEKTEVVRLVGLVIL